MDEPPSNISFVSIIIDLRLIYAISFSGIALLLFASALVSASEVAFFSLQKDDLARCQLSNDPSDNKIIALLNRPRELLATILLFNALINVGTVCISTFLMWHIASTHNPGTVIVGLFIFSLTFTITFFGEIVPKVYAVKKNTSIAKQTAGMWRVLVAFCKPVSKLLLSMGSLVENRIKRKGYTTVEELNRALDLATVNDESSADEKEILKGIVNFGTLTVKQVMRPRLDISAADVNLNFSELINCITKSGFSRMPVYRDSIDKIEGVLYIKDLLPFIESTESFAWQTLLRPGFFIPETKKIDSLLKDFQEKRVHMAIVVDEYGGTSGLITLEDIIEEIIGDINDEFDEIGANYQKIDHATYIFEGKTSLHDFCKTLGVDSTIFDSVKGESESLGGLLLELNNGFPKTGEQISFGQFMFTLESADKKRIKKIKVHIHHEQE